MNGTPMEDGLALLLGKAGAADAPQVQNGTLCGEAINLGGILAQDLALSAFR